jgi:predicted nucleic acid-binding protein
MNAEFIDANVLIYAHDESAGRKREVARELLRRLVVNRQAASSVQVAGEFFVISTRKIKTPLSVKNASMILADMSGWIIHSPSIEDVQAAVAIAARSQIHYWDALVIRSAQVIGASILWSEDLQDGGQFGEVTIRNPFR